MLQKILSNAKVENFTELFLLLLKKNPIHLLSCLQVNLKCVFLFKKNKEERKSMLR